MPIRIAGTLLAGVAAAAVALIAVVASPRPDTDTALACTGGMPSFETLVTETELIVLADAVQVGDSVNHAPPATATAIPSATATLPPSVPPEPTKPPVPTPYVLPHFNLQGIGATFEVKREIVGETSPTIDYDWATRTRLETQLRSAEAGVPPSIGTCSFGGFIVRYEQGREYILFFNEHQGSLNLWGSFPVDDGLVVLDDAMHMDANNGFIYAPTPETLPRYFRGVRTEGGFVKQPRVPLDTVLRAIAGLRGDPSIAPPETGSAGLKGSS